MQSLGVSIHENAQGTSVSLGYNREITAAIRDHSFVLGNPLHINRIFNSENGDDPRKGKKP